MAKQKNMVAILYDFDKTLSPEDVQNYAFFPVLGVAPEEFWKECNEFAVRNNMDKILAMMYMLLKKSNEHDLKITRQAFENQGTKVELFPGVLDWFHQINSYAKSLNLTVEHYIISSGLKEIIEGTPIKNFFTEIYASGFYYDVNGVAKWPATAVNYTNKTQFISRINKGVTDINDDVSLNRFVAKEDRRILKEHMIYIGDGYTDIPCMRQVKSGGGFSVAVHKSRERNRISHMLLEDRADFLALADYTAGSELDAIVKAILEKMAADIRISNLTKKQLKRVMQYKKM